jgi:hypothetical protein
VQPFHFPHIGGDPENIGFQRQEQIAAQEGLGADGGVGHLDFPRHNAVQHRPVNPEGAWFCVIDWHGGNLGKEMGYGKVGLSIRARYYRRMFYGESGKNYDKR